MVNIMVLDHDETKFDIHIDHLRSKGHNIDGPFRDFNDIFPKLFKDNLYDVVIAHPDYERGEDEFFGPIYSLQGLYMDMKKEMPVMIYISSNIYQYHGDDSTVISEELCLNRHNEHGCYFFTDWFPRRERLEDAIEFLMNMKKD